MRVVEDYDVDRRQVQAWRHAQPSRTNHPKSFRVLHAFNAGAAERKHHAVRLRRWRARECACAACVWDVQCIDTEMRYTPAGLAAMPP